MKWSPDYEISVEKSRLDIQWITQALQSTYWASTRSTSVIQRSIDASQCYGVYERSTGAQIGFARVITDNATFAWLCDVVIDINYRKQGLGKQLIKTILSNPKLSGVTIRLATKDAHSLYEQYGFSREEIMRLKKHTI